MDHREQLAAVFDDVETKLRGAIGAYNTLSAKYETSHRDNAEIGRDIWPLGDWLAKLERATYSFKRFRSAQLSEERPSPQPFDGSYPKWGAEEMLLRKLLWLRHGCTGLYGDDGEMQCAKCMIDFLRESPREIERRFFELGTAAVRSVDSLPKSRSELRRRLAQGDPRVDENTVPTADSLRPPDWLQKMALELPDLAAFIRAECGPVGWEYTVTTWASRLQEYVARRGVDSVAVPEETNHE